MRTIRNPKSRTALRRWVASLILSVFQKDTIFHQVIKSFSEISLIDQLDLTRNDIIVSCLMNQNTAAGTDLIKEKPEKCLQNTLQNGIMSLKAEYPASKFDGHCSLRCPYGH